MGLEPIRAIKQSTAIPLGNISISTASAVMCIYKLFKENLFLAFAPPIIYTLNMEVDIMTLFEKFKDKTLFITVQNGTLFPTYKGTILSQVEDFIEFKTENNTIWINLKYIVKFIVVE